MKKVILLSVLLFSCVFIYGQKTAITKSKTIYDPLLSGEKMIAKFFYEDGELSDVLIHLMAQDNTYSKITSFITIAYGNPDEVCDFLSSAIKFSRENNEDGTSTLIGNQYVTLRKPLGVKVLWITEAGGKSGYHVFKEGVLIKAQKKLIEFCQKNKIDLSDADFSAISSDKKSDNKKSKSENNDKVKKSNKVTSKKDKELFDEDDAIQNKPQKTETRKIINEEIKREPQKANSESDEIKLLLDKSRAKINRSKSSKD